jgi:hypothetical protein
MDVTAPNLRKQKKPASSEILVRSVLYLRLIFQIEFRTDSIS